MWRTVEADGDQSLYPKFSPERELGMVYVEQRERNKGTRYRGMYKGADGRYRSAGTFSTPERALEVAQEAEQHAAALISGAIGGLDPATRATRTIEDYTPIFLRHHQVEGNTKDTYEGTLRLHVIPFLGSCRLAETDRTVARNYVTALQEEGRSANVIRQTKLVLGAMFTMAVSDGYLDFNPFHDLKIPKVPGRRAIKVTTTEQFLKVRECLPTRGAQVFATLLVSSGTDLSQDRLTRYSSASRTPTRMGALEPATCQPSFLSLVARSCPSPKRQGQRASRLRGRARRRAGARCR